MGFLAQVPSITTDVRSGVILETFLGGIVEIVLFMVLLHNNNASDNLIPVIRSAILGSILANLLLCLGACFFFGGIGRNEQDFDPAISEVGNGLLLVAGFGLLIPAAFFTSLSGNLEPLVLKEKVITISRITSVILLVAFLTYVLQTQCLNSLANENKSYVFFQLTTHKGIYNTVLELDEERDIDRHTDLVKDKLTLVESLVALAIALTCVSLHAIFLVEEIGFIVSDGGVSDAFMGLILVPLVEKAAEHLTAVDEAWDNQMNFAVAHILGATIQTALFNSSLVVIVGWGLKKNMVSALSLPKSVLPNTPNRTSTSKSSTPSSSSSPSSSSVTSSATANQTTSKARSASSSTSSSPSRPFTTRTLNLARQARRRAALRVGVGLWLRRLGRL